jgi:Beta-carotene isomerase D27-like, C-terminal
MNTHYKNRTLIQQTALETLVSLFPSWLPPQFKQMFANPFPIFSAQLNAYTTYIAGTWLMGESMINDINVTITPTIPIDSTTARSSSTTKYDGKKQGLLVKRCRFLEETNCASICVNSCKIPTQTFFQQYMGIPLLMVPNYTTYECQFSFGQSPTLETELDAMTTPCLLRCPTYGSLREYHHNTNQGNQKYAKNLTIVPTTLATIPVMTTTTTNRNQQDFIPKNNNTNTTPFLDTLAFHELFWNEKDDSMTSTTTTTTTTLSEKEEEQQQQQQQQQCPSMMG